MSGGLDKAGRLAQEAADAAAQLAAATASLDPEFPFTTVSFDPVFFALPADPTPVRKAEASG